MGMLVRFLSNNKLSLAKDMKFLTSGKPIEIWIPADENEGIHQEVAEVVPERSFLKVAGGQADCSTGWEDAMEVWVDWLE